MDISTVVPLWQASLRAAGRSERTIASYTGHVTTFAAELGERPAIGDISAAAIAAGQRRLGQRAAPKTVALALTAIRSLCRFLQDADLRADDPTARLRYPKLGKTLPRALSAEQLRALMAALTLPDDLGEAAAFYWRRNALAIELWLYAGLRLSESADLRWRDVSLDRRLLIVRSGKGDKDRSVPLHAVLVGSLRLVASGRGPNDAILCRRDGKPLAPRSLLHLCERFVPRLGLDFTFTAHQLRHSFGTELIIAGANVFDVQQLMGHEDPKTTRQYYRLAAVHLRNAIDRLPASW